MISYSPNMLKTFEQCPQKYFFKYEKNFIIPQKTSIFETGKKIHALANYYLRGDNIDKLEKALNTEEQKIWNLLKNNQYFQMDYVNSEYNLSCKIGENWIGGRLDALVKKEKDYYILDYKTGSVPKNPEYDFQTIVYLLCLNKKLKSYDNLHFVYIDLKNNQNYLIDFSENKKFEYENKIISICKNIKTTQISENIEYSKKCDFCEYRKICI